MLVEKKKEKRKQRAKWIGDEWCRMIGLASLLYRLIPRLPGELSPILEFPKRIPPNDAWVTCQCLRVCSVKRRPLIDDLFASTGVSSEGQTLYLWDVSPLYVWNKSSRRI